MKPALDIKCVICEQAHDCECRGCGGPQIDDDCFDSHRCTLSPSNTSCYWHEYYKELVITTA